MAQVGESARTPHGPGTITEIDKVRGRGTIYRVAGRGFNAWVDESRCHTAGEGLFSYGPMMAEQARWEHTPQSYMGSEEEAPEMEHMGGLESTIDTGGGSVNKDNSTVLPWNPSPQNPVDMFNRDQGWGPGEYDVDADDRLHSSDSVSGKDTSSDRPSPGPAPYLFAGGETDEDGPTRPDQYDDDWSERNVERAFGKTARTDDQEQLHEQFMGMNDGQVWEHESPHYQGPHPSQDYVDHHGDVPVDAMDEHNYHATQHMEHSPYDAPYSPEQDPRHEGSYRSAGLSSRYAFIPEEIDHRDPITAFRRDPVAFIKTCGHLWTDGDDSLELKYADYTNLIDTDKHMRTAAWTDVRQKAMRLRHEGKVQVNDISDNRIHATIEGDHGIYDTMVLKGGSYGGLGGGQAVSDYLCSCEWGRWAFKRQSSFVGRLCSHGYAAYLEMQSKHIGPEYFKSKKAAGRHEAAIVDDYKNWLEDNNQSPEPASVASFLHSTGKDDSSEQGHENAQKLYEYISDNPAEAPERDYDIPYTNDPDQAYKTADKLLHTRPESMSPNLRMVPKGDDQEWMDLAKDERETTGPDDIMHFSSVMRSLHGGMDDDDCSCDTGETSGKLEELRRMDDEDPHYQHMEEHNDKLRDLVDDLEDDGAYASPMVASNRYADDKDSSDGNGNFQGVSNPTWMDGPFAGSGPDPKFYMSDSAGYVKENEAPRYQDVTEGDGDIVKFNDSRSKPQQGPRNAALDAHTFASLHSAGDGLGYFDPDNVDNAAWDVGSGDQFIDDVRNVSQTGSGVPGGKPSGGGGGAGGEAAAGEAAGGGELAELALLASLNRVGGGPRQTVRVDPGVRGQQQRQAAAPPPEDFGYDGGIDKEAYLNVDEDTDIVANFQRSAGNSALNQTGRSDGDIASSPHVQAMLRTAGRKYSPEEQRQLEEESHVLGARNLPTDEDLFGTHYLGVS